MTKEEIEREVDAYREWLNANVRTQEDGTPYLDAQANRRELMRLARELVTGAYDKAAGRVALLKSRANDINDSYEPDEGILKVFEEIDTAASDIRALKGSLEQESVTTSKG